MSEYEVYSMPKDNLYWKKIELENRAYSLSRKLKNLKSAEKTEEVKREIIYTINGIKKIEKRMQSLYM